MAGAYAWGVGGSGGPGGFEAAVASVAVGEGGLEGLDVGLGADFDIEAFESNSSGVLCCQQYGGGSELWTISEEVVHFDSEPDNGIRSPVWDLEMAS